MSYLTVLVMVVDHLGGCGCGCCRWGGRGRHHHHRNHPAAGTVVMMQTTALERKARMRERRKGYGVSIQMYGGDMRVSG